MGNKELDAVVVWRPPRFCTRFANEEWTHEILVLSASGTLCESTGLSRVLRGLCMWSLEETSESTTKNLYACIVKADRGPQQGINYAQKCSRTSEHHVLPLCVVGVNNYA